MNKKNYIVKPVGLKGKEVFDRMKSLMGATQIKENVNPSVVEITKKGPDGKIYAIVRENHEYYIKVSDESNNLMVESFDYIGGLQNKKDKAYSSYAKALKMLNLKFISLNEAKGSSGSVNVFLNDNLLSEHHDENPNATLSPNKSFGDADEYIVDKKGKELSYNSGVDEETSGDNVAKDGEADDFDEVKLTENEQAIDNMIIEKVEEVKPTTNNRFSITKAISEMDEIIESINPKKDAELSLNTFLDTLNESEKEVVLNMLKKKR